MQKKRRPSTNFTDEGEGEWETSVILVCSHRTRRSRLESAQRRIEPYLHQMTRSRANINVREARRDRARWITFTVNCGSILWFLGTRLRASHREEVTTVHQRQVRAVNAKFTTLPSMGHGAPYFSSSANDGSRMAAKIWIDSRISSCEKLDFFSR